jgi:hypothetical protein
MSKIAASILTGSARSAPVGDAPSGEDVHGAGDDERDEQE